jgi:hypothetical protein
MMAKRKKRLFSILSFVCIFFLVLTGTVCKQGEANQESLAPIDPQQFQDQDLMTWDDYCPIPGRNWADPSLKPERGFRLAVVAIDFPEQPFVITLPKGSDPHERAIALEAPTNLKVKSPNTPVPFTLKNTGTAAETDASAHPADVTAFLNSDVYRLSVSVEGEGWTVQMLNGLAAVEFGESKKVTVYVSHTSRGTPVAVVTMQAASESDPAKTAMATVEVSR